MTAKRKRGGRVTPKGTVNPPKKKADVAADPTRDAPPRHLMQRNAMEKGRGARPMTHNRGNR